MRLGENYPRGVILSAGYAKGKNIDNGNHRFSTNNSKKGPPWLVPGKALVKKAKNRISIHLLATDVKLCKKRLGKRVPYARAETLCC